jgi:hypothetical protein
MIYDGKDSEKVFEKALFAIYDAFAGQFSQ